MRPYKSAIQIQFAIWQTLWALDSPGRAQAVAVVRTSAEVDAFRTNYELRDDARKHKTAF